RRCLNGEHVFEQAVTVKDEPAVALGAALKDRLGAGPPAPKVVPVPDGGRAVAPAEPKNADKGPAATDTAPGGPQPLATLTRPSSYDSWRRCSRPLPCCSLRASTL